MKIIEEILLFPMRVIVAVALVYYAITYFFVWIFIQGPYWSRIKTVFNHLFEK